MLATTAARSLPFTFYSVSIYLSVYLSIYLSIYDTKSSFCYSSQVGCKSSIWHNTLFLSTYVTFVQLNVIDIRSLDKYLLMRQKAKKLRKKYIKKQLHSPTAFNLVLLTTNIPHAVLMAEFTGIVSLSASSFFTLVWAGELPNWLTELQAFLSLLCLFAGNLSWWN